MTELDNFQFSVELLEQHHSTNSKYVPQYIDLLREDKEISKQSTTGLLQKRTNNKTSIIVFVFIIHLFMLCICELILSNLAVSLSLSLSRLLSAQKRKNRKKASRKEERDWEERNNKKREVS